MDNAQYLFKWNADELKARCDANESLKRNDLIFIEGSNRDGEMDFAVGGVIALQQKGGGRLPCLHCSDGEAFLKAISLADHYAFDRRWQWYLMEDSSNAIVTMLDLRGLFERPEIEARRGPKLTPLLEADLQEIAVDRFGAVDADHAINKSTTSAVVASVVKIAG